MKKSIILVIVVLSISVGLIGQEEYLLNSFEPEIIDARAEALGRTSILSSSGANYLFNNPSMLCKLTNQNIQVSGRAILGNTEIKQIFDDEELNLKTEYPVHTKITGLSYAIPCSNKENPNLKWGFGVGFRTYYDWGHNENFELQDFDYESESITTGGFNTLVLGCGLSYLDKLLGGFSFSLPFLSYSSNKFKDNYEEYSSKGTMQGYFLTFSGSYILNKYITVGTRLRTGFTLLREGEYNNGDEYKYNHSIPLEFGLAIEIEPFNRFKLYAEYLTRNLGGFEYQVNDDPTFYSHYIDSNNGYSFRTGFEIDSIIAFRGGLFVQNVPIYENSPYWSEEYFHYFSDFSEKPEAELGFTTGLGIKIDSHISLDLFGTYSYVNYIENYDYYGNSLSADYLLTRAKIGCSMGYSF